MGFFSSNKDKIEPSVPMHEPEVKQATSAPLPTNATTSAKPAEPASTNTYTSTIKTSQNNMTIIAAGTIIEGQMKIDTDIQIDGIIKGTVTSKNKVILGVNGKVDGDINCQEADISGKVTGKINVKDILFLKGAASVDGDIATGKLVMESGVKFNGKCNMTGSMATPPPSTPTPPPASNGISTNNTTEANKVNG